MISINNVKSAFLTACLLDVLVSKPGNVSFMSPGHGMTAKLFVNSSKVVVPILFDENKTLGQKIEQSVKKTFETVNCNTNLGIILLCAPLIQAIIYLIKKQPKKIINQKIFFSLLKIQVKKIIQNTTIDDAKFVFRAIKIANPGGLGVVKRADIRGEPNISLLDVMRIGSKRDFIARQYANYFFEVFNQEFFNFVDLKNKVSKNKPANESFFSLNPDEFVLKIYLNWLTKYQDTHIRRKYGSKVSKQILDEACCFLFHDNSFPVESEKNDVNIYLPSEKKLLAWDYSLKKRNINPGTSADLTVCTLFLVLVLLPNLRSDLKKKMYA
ncbi:MAG: hypothetical protein CBD16_06975 [Betaproteobacteria bacterium TMED156]|nr:MAG: hypothetical protein CBD16_06975 [Betaproteobacteria bacterium TMED156]|tara:strand:+ start:347 stop:1324 length:978 start_codon:yes stop_codon:yes gene_type:complete